MKHYFLIQAVPTDFEGKKNMMASGPYDSAEHQKAAARLLMIQGEEVYYIDVVASGFVEISSGRVRMTDSEG